MCLTSCDAPYRCMNAHNAELQTSRVLSKHLWGKLPLNLRNFLPQEVLARSIIFVVAWCSG